MGDPPGHSGERARAAGFPNVHPVADVPVAMRSARVLALVGEAVPGRADHPGTVEELAAERRVTERVNGLGLPVVPMPGGWLGGIPVALHEEGEVRTVLRSEE